MLTLALLCLAIALIVIAMITNHFHNKSNDEYEDYLVDIGNGKKKKKEDCELCENTGSIMDYGFCPRCKGSLIGPF